MTEPLEDQGALPEQPAGWYASPSHLPTRKIERFWSGSRWTDELRVKGKDTTIDELRSQLRFWRISWTAIAILGWGLWILAAYLNFPVGVLIGLFLVAVVVSIVSFFGYSSAKQQLKELRSAGLVNAFLSGQNLNLIDRNEDNG